MENNEIIGRSLCLSYQKYSNFEPATPSFPVFRVLISMQDLGGAYSPSRIQYQM